MENTDGNLHALDRWMEKNERAEELSSSIINSYKGIFVELAKDFDTSVQAIEDELRNLATELEDVGLDYDINELADIVSDFKGAESVSSAISVAQGDC
jgi:uncharacterized protein (UPF0335 family)